MVRSTLLLLTTALLLSCELPLSTSGPSLIPVKLDSGVGQATAHWDPVPGAEGYRVAWTTSSPGVAGGSIETVATTAVVDRLAPGVDYEVTVTAWGQGETLARGKATWSSEGWTWESGSLSTMTGTTSDAQTFDLGDGNWVVFVTERTFKIEVLGRLSYTTSGLNLTYRSRTTTTPPKTGEPEVVEKSGQTTPATWLDPWARFTVSADETVTFSADRKTFTLASSPDVEWHWVP